MNFLLDIFKAINANQHPSQLALSIVLALWFGLTPLLSPSTLVLILLIFVLRIHLGIVIIFGGIFGGISYLLDPAFHHLGLWALNHPDLQGFWTAAYNNPVWLYLGFNNTIFMGSLLVTSLLSLPLFLVTWQLLKFYRARILSWANKLKLVKLIKANSKVQFLMRLAS